MKIKLDMTWQEFKKNIMVLYEIYREIFQCGKTFDP
jgi:hypothetical protein